MRTTVVLVTVVAASLAAISAVAPRTTSAADVACSAAVVHLVHYPGPGFAQSPWVKAAPASQGLVGLLWYWPNAWRDQHVTTAQVYAGGESPEGMGMKIMWRFLAPAARTAPLERLTVKGTRLDAPGKSWQRFSPISYTGQDGAPTFASTIDLPTPGCWRIDLSAGSLHGTTIIRAISAN